jgi:hypothetical protein
LLPVDTLNFDSIGNYPIGPGKIIPFNDTLYIFGRAKNSITNEVQIYLVRANLNLDWVDYKLIGNVQKDEQMTDVYLSDEGFFILVGLELTSRDLFIIRSTKEGEIVNYIEDSVWSAHIPKIVYLKEIKKFHFVDLIVSSIYHYDLSYDTTIFNSMNIVFGGFVKNYNDSKYFVGANNGWVYKKNTGIGEAHYDEDFIEISYFLQDTNLKSVDSGFISLPNVDDLFGGLDFIPPNNLVFGGVHNYYVLEGYPLFFERDPRKIVVKSINYDTKDKNWYFEYGGDVNYLMKGLYVDEETGGCIVYANRYDWRESQLLQRDILIFKIDSTGLLVGETEIPVKVQNEMVVYPNPGNNHLFVKRINGQSEIALYDLYGRKVLSAVVEGEQTPVSTGMLKNGVYFYKVQSKDSENSFSGVWIKR